MRELKELDLRLRFWRSELYRLTKLPFFILTQLTKKYIPPKRDVSAMKIGLFPGDPRFFMNRLLAAPVAELFEFHFALNLLLVLVGIIIPPLANAAPQRY